jgi:RES domain-containing protein
VPVAWRVVKTLRVAEAFDGEGARLHGGRWNSPGTAAVYASETRALAMLEILAGLGETTGLANYSLIPVTFEDELVEVVAPSSLPKGWDARPPGAASQGLGDHWLAAATSAVLRVPSVLVPAEYNYVLNPKHADFHAIEIGEPVPLPLDPRLRHP